MKHYTEYLELMVQRNFVLESDKLCIYVRLCNF